MITSFQPYPPNGEQQYLGQTRVITSTPITQAGTNRHYMALPVSLYSQMPNVFYFKDAAVILSGATAAAFTGTLTARIVKRKANGTIVNLTATAAIATASAQFTVIRFTPGTATDVEMTIQEGDVLALELVHAGGTVSQQPNEWLLSARVCVIKS